MLEKSLKDQAVLEAPMPPESPMLLETPRLIIRPLRDGDGQALYEAKLETWDSLSKTFGWAAGQPDLENDETYVRKAYDDYMSRRDFSFVGLEKETVRPVLWTGIHEKQSPKEFQIGYWVRKSAQGKGYAKEAAEALVQYAFNQLAANRLVMCHTECNKVSAHIIKSLGFEYEGLREKSLVCAGGEIKDAHWYSYHR